MAKRADVGIRLVVWVWSGALAVLGCGPDCKTPPPVFTPALIVEVIDAASREPICDAQVMLERGGSVVRVQAVSCRFSSESMSPGRYRVRVEHPDYQAAEEEAVVPEDECGAAEQRGIEVELTAR